MNTTVKVSPGGGSMWTKLAMLVLLAVACGEWAHERDLRAKAEATAAASKRQIGALSQQEATRDAETTEYARKLTEAQQAIKTPQQAVQVITRYLPAVPGRAETAPVVVQKDELPPQTQEKLPDAPSYTILTQDQAKAVAQNDLQCDADQNSLKACNLDRQDDAEKLLLQQAATNAWETAAKGGTKLHRLVKVLKVAGCAAAGGLVGAEVTGSFARGPLAAAGAGAGVVGCSIFLRQ